jgi:hypothetical protein
MCAGGLEGTGRPHTMLATSIPRAKGGVLAVTRSEAGSVRCHRVRATISNKEKAP